MDARYDEFVERSPQGTVFATSWWLESVAPGRSDAVVIEHDGRIVAAWPFVRRDDGWPRRIEMPPLTPWLGVLFEPDGQGKIAKRLGRQKDLVEQLVAGMPPQDVIRARCHPSFNYWSPLFWQGFTQTTRYTFVLSDIRDAASTWSGFRDNIRTDVRKAERSGVRVYESDDISEFWRVHQSTFQRQGVDVPYDFELFRRVDDACAQRGVRRMFVARDSAGRAHAAAFIVWDRGSAYYLLGGGDPILRNSGATALTLWHAIQFAAQFAPVFDFEGSMLEPVERFIRSFGATPQPYSAVERIDSRALALLTVCRSALRRARGHA